MKGRQVFFFLQALAVGIWWIAVILHADFRSYFFDPQFEGFYKYLLIPGLFFLGGTSLALAVHSLPLGGKSRVWAGVYLGAAVYTLLFALNQYLFSSRGLASMIVMALAVTASVVLLKRDQYL